MMNRRALGKIYQDGEIIVRQNEQSDSLFVIQQGQVEIFIERDGHEVPLRVVGKNDLIGEMAIFRREARSATARARGPARVLTLDKKNFLRRISEDPSLAFRIIEAMARRINELSQEVVDLKVNCGETAGAKPSPS